MKGYILSILLLISLWIPFVDAAPKKALLKDGGIYTVEYFQIINVHGSTTLLDAVRLTAKFKERPEIFLIYDLDLDNWDWRDTKQLKKTLVPQILKTIYPGSRLQIEREDRVTPGSPRGPGPTRTIFTSFYKGRFFLIQEPEHAIKVRSEASEDDVLGTYPANLYWPIRNIYPTP